MRILILIIGVVGFAALSLHVDGRLRSLSPWSKLGWFETRIASVESEFARRSPEYRSTLTKFKHCVNTDGCDYNPILAERDQIIARLWPEILERLLVEADWGKGAHSAEAHQRFDEKVTDVVSIYGKKELVNCPPAIEWHEGYEPKFAGFSSCPTEFVLPIDPQAIISIEEH